MGGMGLGLGMGLGSDSAAFSPDSMFAASEDGGYYEVSDLSTVWQDSARTTPGVVGQPVGALDDLSGNGHHLLQATTAAKPILRQNGSGKYYLEGDGVDDVILSSTTLTISSPMYTGAALGRVSTSTGTVTAYTFFGPRFGGTTRHDVAARMDTSYIPYVISRFNASATVQVAASTANAMNAANPFILDGYLDADSSDAYSRDSAGGGGTGTLGATAGSPSPEACSIRAFSDAACPIVRHFYGGIAVLRSMSAADLTNVRTWLGERNGVTV